MPLLKVQCPACGGMLEWVEGQEAVHCAFCDTLVWWDRGGQIGAQAHLELATTFLQANDVSAAEEHLARAVEIAPKNSEAWMLKAVAAVLQHNFVAAATYARKADVTPAMVAQRLAALLPPQHATTTLLHAAAQTAQHWEWGEALLEAALCLDDGADNTLKVIGVGGAAALWSMQENILDLNLQQAFSRLERIFDETMKAPTLQGLSHTLPPDGQGYTGLAYRAALAGDFPRALGYLERAVELCAHPRDTARVGQALVLALAAGWFEEWALAIAYVQQAARRAAEDKSQVAATCLQLSISARDQFAYEPAAQFLEAAYRMDDRVLKYVVGDPQQGYIGLALHIGRVGAPHTDCHRPEQARTRLEQAATYLERALQLERKVRRWVATAYIVLAREAGWGKESALRWRFWRRAVQLDIWQLFRVGQIWLQ